MYGSCFEREIIGLHYSNYFNTMSQYALSSAAFGGNERTFSFISDPCCLCLFPLTLRRGSFLAPCMDVMDVGTDGHKVRGSTPIDMACRMAACFLTSLDLFCRLRSVWCVAAACCQTRALRRGSENRATTQARCPKL